MFYSLKQKILTDIKSQYKSVEVQPGKEYTMSLYSTDKQLHNNLKKIILEINPAWTDSYDFIYSSNCLNIIR